MADQLPFITHQGIHLACPSQPVRLLALPIPPKRIYIHHRETPIPRIAHFHSCDLAPVVNQVMFFKESLIEIPPALMVKSPQNGLPSDRVMVAA